MSTRASTRMTRYTVELPKAAIAGLVGSRAERLNDIQDTTVRVCPISHAWNTSGDIYVGCQGGQLLKVGEYNYNCYINSRNYMLACLSYEINNDISICFWLQPLQLENTFTVHH